MVDFALRTSGNPYNILYSDFRRFVFEGRDFYIQDCGRYSEFSRVRMLAVRDAVETRARGLVFFHFPLLYLVDCSYIWD